MFASEFSVIFFKLLNFAALLALFTFVYRKYIRSTIVQGIQGEKEAESLLNERIITLSQKGHNLNDDISSQEKLCRSLLEKADRWRSVTEREYENRRLKLQEYEKNMRNLVEKRTKVLEQQRINARMVPKVVHYLDKEVDAIFSDKQRVHEYTNILIQGMRKSQS